MPDIFIGQADDPLWWDALLKAYHQNSRHLLNPQDTVIHIDRPTELFKLIDKGAVFSQVRPLGTRKRPLSLSTRGLVRAGEVCQYYSKL